MRQGYLFKAVIFNAIVKVLHDKGPISPVMAVISNRKDRKP